MQMIRYGLIVLWMLTCSATFAAAQVSIGIGLPNVSIGINLPSYPELVPVPGYPVYYAPRMDANYFFYDGMYWVYQDDNWYASSWYNGPWSLVGPEVVPLFILRIPVSYYRQPPVYFRGWQSNAPPRWGQHWGHGWEQRRSGWDRWQRASAPARAPLPTYQRQYSGDRYPRVEQQQTLRSNQYRYQPRDAIVRQHFKQVEQKASAPAQRGRQEAPPVRNSRQPEPQRSTPLQQSGPAVQHSQPTHQTAPQQRGPAVQGQRQQPGAAQHSQPTQQTPPQQRGPAVQGQKQQPPRQTPPQQRGPAVQGQQRQQPGAAQREQQPPRAQGQEQRSPDRGKSPEPRQGSGEGQKNDEGRGR
jgi:hypothetical protein